MHEPIIAKHLSWHIYCTVKAVMHG